MSDRVSAGQGETAEPLSDEEIATYERVIRQGAFGSRLFEAYKVLLGRLREAEAERDARRERKVALAECEARESALRLRVREAEQALRLIRDGRCSCGYRFKWTGNQLRCENCGTHEGYGVPGYVREIVDNALAAVGGKQESKEE